MEKKLDEKEKGELEKNIKKEIEKQNKLLKNIFIVFGGIVVLAFFIYLFVNSLSHFEYKGVDFVIEKYCDAKPCLTLYKTSIPISYEDSLTGKIVEADYNIYLRNNPKKLEKVSVEGEIIFRRNMVLSVDDEKLFCDGDRVIAVGNIQKLEILGVNLIAKNESEIKVYVPQNEYMFVDIKESNETDIIQKSENSYEINVADCEILKATERLMVEAFIQAHSEN